MSPLQNEVGGCSGLWLGQGADATVRLLARILSRALATPLVAPISIQIRSHAEGAVISPPILPPQSFLLVRVLVSVRVHQRHDVEIQGLQFTIQTVAILNQLVYDVRHSGHRYPLPGMSACGAKMKVSLYLY